MPLTAPSATDQAPTAQWHHLSASRVLQLLGSGLQGLGAEQAAQRLRDTGPNRLHESSATPWWRRLLAQFNNLLIGVLLVAAGITAAMGHALDALVIAAVVLLNVVIGLVQEGKAERAMQAIRHLLAPRALVLRDGRAVEVDAAQLVPGDVVQIASGDAVPADLRLLSVHQLAVDESALTGESVPVEKRLEEVAADAALGDRLCLAFAGTLVTRGQARGVVFATASQTQVGRIGSLLSAVEATTTPLVRQMAQLTRWITGAILAVASLLFAFGWLVRGLPVAEMFLNAVALAVAAIPEGLPAVMTITLAIGVQRMAARHAIVRQLPAVETLGAVTVICSDKTGTLTRNEMTVQQVVVGGECIDVEGIGYAPQGRLRFNGETLSVEHLARAAPALLALAETAVLCNEAALVRDPLSGQWQVAGDPTEGALLSLAMKVGIDPVQRLHAMPRTAVIPFESEHRYMATAHEGVAGESVRVKGAAERVLAMCSHERTRDGVVRPLVAAPWHRAIEEQASRGRRVLALACKERAHSGPLQTAEVEDGLTLLGLVGIIDPPRSEAIAAVAQCRAAGIRVKMITGDHAATAAAIAAQLGMVSASSPVAVTGAQIETMDDARLREVVRETDVFARASPEHKLRLVRALQAQGEVVAMTGDGVNDAPALKQADVGVAMGRKGTEAAKRAGAIVLADDNFASIAHAVEEGRTVNDNLRKTIAFMLPINGGESLSLLLAVLLGLALPIAPVQILWVNMVSSVALAMVLAFEPTEADVMRRPPRAPTEPMLSPFVVWRIALVSTLFLIGIFGQYEWALARGATVEEARTMAVNTLVAMEVFYLFSVRYLKAPSFTWRGIQGTPRVLAAVGAVVFLQALFTYAPFMQRWFDTRALGMDALLLCVLSGLALLMLLETEKRILRRRR